MCLTSSITLSAYSGRQKESISIATTYWHGLGCNSWDVLDHEEVEHDLHDFHLQLVVRRIELLDEKAERVCCHFLPRR